MERYIAVDVGKFETKVAYYDKEKDETKMYRFRTRTGEGSFDDDTLERNTFISQINDGPVMRIGNAASTQAEMSISKATQTHKDCLLTAIALYCSSDEVDNVYVAIGTPVKTWEIVEKRNEYKEYMLPEGEIEVKLKLKGDGEILTKKFVIETRKAFPESMGALYIGDTKKYVDDMVAIIDIGGLNVNATVWNSLELDRESAITNELGGNALVLGLAQALTSELSMRADERITMKALALPKNERMLHPKRNNPEIEQKSKEVIDKFTLEHARKIKQECNTKQWPIDYMTLIFIGGTSGILRNEISEVFGDDVLVVDNPEYANALGFLRVLCAQSGIDHVIPLPAA